MPTISELATALRDIAPPALAESWDNTGLLIGDSQASATRVLTCLTLTSDVADEALREGAELIVSHHPVLFRPVQKLTADDAQGAMLLRLIAGRVAVYSPHTSYDSSAGGINQQLAEALALQAISPLRPAPGVPRLKLVIFVPVPHLEPVQQALWQAGAGQIGQYSKCSFYAPGCGTFHGSDESHPAVGQAGRFEKADEVRLEVMLPERSLAAVVAALRSAHPYEEPAFDVYALRGLPGLTGGGRWGTLPRPVSLQAFNDLVKQALGIGRLQFIGDPQAEIRKVAIACGAAAEFLTDAAARDCQVLLTGEARFHDCLKARDLGLGLVLPGHYATERPGVERLARLLQGRFPDLTAWASRVEVDPLQWD